MRNKNIGRGTLFRVILNSWGGRMNMVLSLSEWVVEHHPPSLDRQRLSVHFVYSGLSNSKILLLSGQRSFNFWDIHRFMVSQNIADKGHVGFSGSPCTGSSFHLWRAQTPQSQSVWVLETCSYAVFILSQGDQVEDNSSH
jgi:hypothetical protein